VPESKSGHFEEGDISCACYDLNPRLFCPQPSCYISYTIPALFLVKCKLQLQRNLQQHIIIPGYRSGDYVPSGDTEIPYHLYTQCIYVFCTGCPTTYQTRQFFNNFANNEDIATKFEADLPQCVRNMTTS